MDKYRIHLWCNYQFSS